MTLEEIRKMPTCVDEIPAGSKGVHESCLRAWNILNMVEYYLDENVPPKIVLGLIEEMRGDKVNVTTYQPQPPRKAMSDKEENKESDMIMVNAKARLYTYEEMLNAYKTGKDHEKKYGNCDPLSDRPNFIGFIRRLNK